MRLDTNKAIHSASQCRRRVNLAYRGQGSSLQTLQPRMKRRGALLCALTSTASLPQMLAKTHRFTASDISNREGLQYGAMSCSTISTTEGVSLLLQAVNNAQNAMACLWLQHSLSRDCGSGLVVQFCHLFFMCTA